jgi:hypothetical protein
MFGNPNQTLANEHLFMEQQASSLQVEKQIKATESQKKI